MDSVKINALLTSETAKLPQYQTEFASGADLYAAIDAPLSIKPLERVLVPTCLILEIPAGYEGQVRPRSGVALKYGVTVLNAPGTIDADYRGEIGVILVNLGSESYTIQPHDRIAQLVISPVVKAVFSLERECSAAEITQNSDRGAGGFGHTGR